MARVVVQLVQESMVRYFLLGCLCAALTAVPAMAKDGEAKPAKDVEAMMALYAKLATPGAPHQLLASLEGGWDTETKEWLEPGKPPLESTGTADMKMLLGGRFLQEESRGSMMGKPISSIIIYAYDNFTKNYVVALMGSVATRILVMKGTASADGKTITFTGEQAEPGVAWMKHRAVWKILDNDRQSFEMYNTPNDGEETKMLETDYTRKR